jgi:hypothetical protein
MEKSFLSILHKKDFIFRSHRRNNFLPANGCPKHARIHPLQKKRFYIYIKNVYKKPVVFLVYSNLELLTAL